MNKYDHLLQNKELNDLIVKQSWKSTKDFYYDNSVTNDDLYQELFIKAMGIVDDFEETHDSYIDHPEFLKYFSAAIKNKRIDIKRAQSAKKRSHVQSAPQLIENKNKIVYKSNEDNEPISECQYDGINFYDK